VINAKRQFLVGEENSIDGQTSIGLQGSVPFAEADNVGMEQKQLDGWLLIDKRKTAKRQYWILWKIRRL